MVLTPCCRVTEGSPNIHSFQLEFWFQSLVWVLDAQQGAHLWKPLKEETMG